MENQSLSSSSSSEAPSSSLLNGQRNQEYGSLPEDDSISLGISFTPDPLEFRNKRTKNCALIAILVCAFFDWVAFSLVTFWIPLTMQLNAFLFVGSQPDAQFRSYYRYLHRFQKIPGLTLIALYSSSMVAGIVMDAFLRKTKFVFISISLAYIGLLLMATNMVTLGHYLNCTRLVNNSFLCYHSGPVLCRYNADDICCLDFYTAIVYTFAVLGGVARTALPILGGDQIPERNGVRVFYAGFFWFQKLAEIFAAILCLCYLIEYDARDKYQTANHEYLTYGWSIALYIACGVCFISLIIVICGGLIRQVSPTFSVIKDTWQIWWQAFRLRKERQEDDGYLELTKYSRGGNFVDQAVDERIDMAKFGVVLLLLLPVAFCTMLPALPIVDPHTYTNSTVVSILEESLELCISTVLIYVTKYCVMCIVIPAIHGFCSLMNKRGYPVTLLYRFIAGYISVILSLFVMMITPQYRKTYTWHTRAAPMVLAGISNAFVYTTAFEMVMISAPRAMQGTAMGMFYLMDGIANTLNMLVIMYAKPNNLQYIDGIGGIGSVLICCLLLIIIERKYNLGLSRI